MEDLSLRAAFHRALDPLAPPAPWLAEAVKQDLRRRRQAQAEAAGRPRTRWSLTPVMPRLTAALLILALILAGMAAFAALNVYLHHGIPALGPKHAARVCLPIDGFVAPDGSRWQGGQPPKVRGFLSGSQAECVIDSSHAWVTETASGAPSATIAVISTANAGKSWSVSEQLPTASPNPSALLDFADENHGWLFTDSGVSTVPNFQRTVYATTDGGLHWTKVASGAGGDGTPLGTTGHACTATGLVMSTAGRGWITWSCIDRGIASSTAVPPVAQTTDGGRTWTAVALPLAEPGAGATCGAQPGAISGLNGVIPFVCTGLEQRAGVYRTVDAGETWAAGDLPFFTRTGVEFADGLNGYLVRSRRIPGSGDTSALFATKDGGKTWAQVATSMFPGRDIAAFGFFDAATGYAVVQQALWFTFDAGRTWTVAPPLRSVGYTLCSQPAPAVAANAPLTAPRMFGTSVGWDAGARRTSDAGAHWSSVSPPFVKLAAAGYGESFLDGDDAWAVESVGSSIACADHVFVYRTTDGGQSWSRVASVNVPVSDAARDWTPAVQFVDRQHGWLFASTGALYRSDDGGVHWTSVSTAVGVNNTGCAAGPGVYFSSASTGWMPLQCPFDGNNNPGPYRVVVTRDGGLTWSVQTITSAITTYSSVLPTFTDSQHGVIWDPGTMLLAVTSDGGRSWAVRTPPISGYPCVGKGGTSMTCSNDSIAGVSFINPNQGWALIGTFSAPNGKGGPYYMTYRLERTTNAGRTWYVQTRFPTRPAPDGAVTLQFVDANDAFWMDGSRWYQTRDGGRTWTLVFTAVVPQT